MPLSRISSWIPGTRAFRRRTVDRHLRGLTVAVRNSPWQPTDKAGQAAMLRRMMHAPQQKHVPSQRLRNPDSGPMVIADSACVSAWVRMLQSHSVPTLSVKESTTVLTEMVESLTRWIAAPQRAAVTPEQIGRRLATELALDAECFGRSLTLIQSLCDSSDLTARRRAELVSLLVVGYTHGSHRRLMDAQQLSLRVGAVAQAEVVRSLARRRAEFLSHFNDFAIGMGLLDTTGRIIAANKALNSNLGLVAEPLDASLQDLLERNDSEILLDGYRQLSAAHPHFETSVRVRGVNTGHAQRNLALHWFGDSDGDDGIHLVLDTVAVGGLSPSWLRRAARRDAVSSLPGMDYLTYALANALARASERQPIGLCLLRLRALPALRRIHGAAAADHIVGTVTPRLTAISQGAAVVARLAADTFAVLFTGVETLTGMREFEARYRGWLGVAAHPDGQPLLLDPVVTVDSATYPTTRDLLNQALHRLDQSQGTQHTHPPAAQFADDTDDLELLVGLPAAFRREEVELAYLPTLRLRDNTLVAAEATLRWRHPTRGVIPIDHLIRNAENVGMRLPLSTLFRTACAHARGWREALGISAPKLIVNVPPLMARTDSMAHHLASALRSTGLPSESVHLGLTEESLLARSGELRPHLITLAHSGVRLRLNNVGTAFRRFDRLPRLMLQHIAIPTSSTADPSLTRTITGHLVMMGHELHQTVTVQGLDNPADLAHARKVNADYAQGKAFGDPCPAQDILRWAQHRELATTHQQMP